MKQWIYSTPEQYKDVNEALFGGRKNETKRDETKISDRTSDDGLHEED